MPIHPSLLEMLRCPACHGEVAPVDADRGLKCAECGRVYPIRDGIPDMMVEEGSPPEDDPGR
jgi:uncharacterized protein YbaR (Trm112 family)